MIVSAPTCDVAIDVGRRRILDRDARRHQLRVLLLSHDAAHCRQLGAAVDAANLVGVCDGDGFDRRPALPVDRDEIGQVILALRVFRADAAHRVEQPVEREGVNARVDLADRPLGRRGVLLLDNTCNLLAGSRTMRP